MKFTCGTCRFETPVARDFAIHVVETAHLEIPEEYRQSLMDGGYAMEEFIQKLTAMQQFAAGKISMEEAGIEPVLEGEDDDVPD